MKSDCATTARPFYTNCQKHTNIQKLASIAKTPLIWPPSSPQRHKLNPSLLPLITKSNRCCNPVTSFAPVLVVRLRRAYGAMLILDFEFQFEDRAVDSAKADTSLARTSFSNRHLSGIVLHHWPEQVVSSRPSGRLNRRDGHFDQIPLIWIVPGNPLDSHLR